MNLSLTPRMATGVDQTPAAESANQLGAPVKTSPLPGTKPSHGIASGGAPGRPHRQASFIAIELLLGLGHCAPYGLLTAHAKDLMHAVCYATLGITSLVASIWAVRRGKPH